MSAVRVLEPCFRVRHLVQQRFLEVPFVAADEQVHVERDLDDDALTAAPGVVDVAEATRHAVAHTQRNIGGKRTLEMLAIETCVECSDDRGLFGRRTRTQQRPRPPGTLIALLDRKSVV